MYGDPIESVAKLCEGLMQTGTHEVHVYATANGDTELPVTPNKTVVVNGVLVTYFARLTKDHTHVSPSLLMKADLFVLVSYNENFANSVVEALHMGTPVLISDTVGLATFVKEKQMG